MNDVTSSMINVFRTCLADGELERIGELMKALEGRPESEIAPLWDFYTGHWVAWFLEKFEPQLTRARYPLKLVAIDRPGGYCIELYESLWQSGHQYKLNTVAVVGIHSEDAALRLQTALFRRLDDMAPSAFIVPEIVMKPEKVFYCPQCGGALRNCATTFCLHCDECDLVTTHHEMLQQGA